VTSPDELSGKIRYKGLGTRLVLRQALRIKSQGLLLKIVVPKKTTQSLLLPF